MVNPAKSKGGQMNGKQTKNYQIPETVLNGIINVLAALPYRDIAPVMAEIHKVIGPQQNQGQGSKGK